MTQRSFARLWATATIIIAAFGARSVAAQGQALRLLDYSTGVPAEWQARAPSSSMRLAEFTVPGRGGGAVAEVVVYFFGMGQGGSADANIGRWRSQFSNPDGTVYERISRDSTAALPTTLAEWRGTYARGVGTGATAGDARPNHTLVAAIVETPRGTLFFQLFGPSASVVGSRDSFLAFVRALK
jgi:hypothetical protein